MGSDCGFHGVTHTLLVGFKEDLMRIECDRFWIQWSLSNNIWVIFTNKQYSDSVDFMGYNPEYFNVIHHVYLKVQARGV